MGADIFPVCLLLAAAVLYLSIRAAVYWRRERLAARLRSWSLTQPGPQPRNLQMGGEAQARPAAPPRYRPPASVWVGAVLIVTGLVAFAVVQHWTDALTEATDDVSVPVLLWLCLLCAGGGGVLLAMAAAGRFRKPLPPVAPLDGARTRGGNFRWKRRPPVPRPFSGLSYVALILTFGLVVVWIPNCVCWSLTYLVPNGLPVHLLRPAVVARRNPGMQPVLIRIAGESPASPSVYVDSRQVTWDSLAAVLQKEVNRRPPNWPVYVEGGPDMEWKWAVRAVDIVQGLQARAILLTPADMPQRLQR